MAQAIPVGGIGRADERSGAAILLASERGSFINGAEILIDGGMKVNGEARPSQRLDLRGGSRART